MVKEEVEEPDISAPTAAVGDRNDSSEEETQVRQVSRYQDRPPGVGVKLEGDECEESDDEEVPGGGPPEEPPGPDPEGPGTSDTPIGEEASEEEFPRELDEEVDDEGTPELDDQLLGIVNHFGDIDKEEAQRRVRDPAPRPGSYDVRVGVEQYVPPAVPLTEEQKAENLRIFTQANVESRRRTKEAKEAEQAASVERTSQVESLTGTSSALSTS